MKLRRLQISSVRLRLTLWNVSVLTLLLVVLGTILWYTVKARLLHTVDWELRNRAQHVIFRWTRDSELGLGPFHLRFPFGPLINPQQRRIIDSWITEQSRRGQSVPAYQGSGAAGPSGSPSPGLPIRFLNLPGQTAIPAWMPGVADKPWDVRGFMLSTHGQEALFTVQLDGAPIRVLSMPLRRGEQVVGVLQTASPLAEMDRDLDGLFWTLLTLLPLVVLAAGAGGAFLTERALRPVCQITKAAEQIGVQDLSRRLPVAGEDEFAELAKTFNGMLGRLEQAFEQQQRFTADASHELRSPLTLIQGNTSMALSRQRTATEYRQALAATDRAARQMGKIIEDLLLLAYSDAGQLALDLRPTSLREVLKFAQDAVAGRSHTPIEIVMSETDLSVQGDASHLTRLFTNLLDNAARYTPPEGCITLSATGDEASVTVSVEDTGIGIAPEHLPHVRERFYRVDAARNRSQGGAGLGLAISQSIVEAHQGTMTIESCPGRGTCVRVTLQRAWQTGVRSRMPRREADVLSN